MYSRKKRYIAVPMVLVYSLELALFCLFCFISIILSLPFLWNEKYSQKYGEILTSFSQKLSL